MPVRLHTGRTHRTHRVETAAIQLRVAAHAGSTGVQRVQAEGQRDGPPKAEESGAPGRRPVSTAARPDAQSVGQFNALTPFPGSCLFCPRALDDEEFGSVYESLLDYLPLVLAENEAISRRPDFQLVAGTERRQTGSYYTPPELVRELAASALIPVVNRRLQDSRTAEAKEEALLSLKVCDPAAGSGHFLLAVARRIARDLACARSSEEEPPPTEYHTALRDIVRNCIYAVDKNRLAVDLCKVALWIESHAAGDSASVNLAPASYSEGG